MSINRAFIYKFKLPLHNAMVIRGQNQRFRSGLLLELRDGQGFSGWGEISPLPGVHRESLDTAQKQLGQVTGSLLADGSIPRLRSPEKILAGDFTRQAGCPSVAFGLEMALLSHMGLKLNRPVARFFTEKPSLVVKINGLLTGNSTSDLVAETGVLVNKGYKILKLKVGNDTLSTDMEKVSTLTNLFEGKIKFILDANRAWRLDVAIQFGKTVNHPGILYIEEPVEKPEQCDRFFRKTGMPFAFDESLSAENSTRLAAIPGGRAFVIKPNRLGPLHNSLSIIHTAREHNLNPVISSTFDSGLGLAFLAQLAAAFGAPGTYAGLDTYRWLKKDVLNYPLTTKNYLIKLESVCNTSHSLNRGNFKLVETIS